MKQSTKQLFSILTIFLFIGQSVYATDIQISHIHPNHRRLSQQGIINLSIDGAGFFAYALRVKEPGQDSAADESMLASSTYDGAYSTVAPGPENSAANAGQQTDGAVKQGKCYYRAAVTEACAIKTPDTTKPNEACTVDAGNGCLYDDDTESDPAAAADADAPNNKCVYTAPVTEKCINSDWSTSDLVAEVTEACTDADGTTEDAQCNLAANLLEGGTGDGPRPADAAAAKTACEGTDDSNGGGSKCKYTAKVEAAAAVCGLKENQAAGGTGTTQAANAAAAKTACESTDDALVNTGAENTEPESGYYIQVVYSRDGSLHVNRYGFLVDDNGLLLMGAAVDSSVTPATEKLPTTVAKEAIHIPSRAEDVVVTAQGRVVAKEQGTLFTTVGQIKLTRFANPMGLNIRLKMKSRCSSMNEIGFSLGNWCAGGPLDGKPHEYLAESTVSGPGEKGNPGDAGMGYIVQ